MAIGDKIFLADKQTLDEANEKIGTNIDTAGTITVFSRLKQIYDYMASVIPNSRAAKIDNLDTTISSRQVSVLTSTHADMIDAAISTRASQASVNTLATQTSVNTLTTNVGSNVDAASATGSVHAKLKDIKAGLSNSGTPVAIPSNNVKDIILNSLRENNLVGANNGQLIARFIPTFSGIAKLTIRYPVSNNLTALWMIRQKNQFDDTGQSMIGVKPATSSDFYTIPINTNTVLDTLLSTNSMWGYKTQLGNGSAGAITTLEFYIKIDKNKPILFFLGNTGSGSPNNRVDLIQLSYDLT